MNSKDRLGRIALLALVLLAAGLRFHRLSAQDIWGDEAFSIALSLRPLSSVVAGAADTHPPFYPLLLYLWLRGVGATALAARALSVLVGILVVPLVFAFSRQAAPRRPRVAWFAALLAAISPLLVYYSQETRMYELVAVLSLASLYFTLRFVAAENAAALSARKQEPVRDVLSWGRWTSGAAYWIVTALAAFTHYSAFFVMIAENVFVAARWWSERGRPGGLAIRTWAILQALIVAAYIPWVVVQASFLGSKANLRLSEWSWHGVEQVLGKTLIAFSAGLTAGSPLAEAATALFVTLAAIGVIGIARAQADARAAGRALPGPIETRSSVSLAWLAPLAFGVPVMIAWLLNPIMPFFFERYVLVALPGLYVTTALGLDVIAHRSAGAAAVLTGACVLVAAFSLSNYYYDETYAKGKYGQMMAYVESHARQGDALVLNNPLQKPLFEYYRPRDLPAFFLPDGAPLQDPATRQQLADIAQSHSRLWLVRFGNPAEYDPTGYLERWLGAHAFKSLSRGYVDAHLSLYVMPNASTLTIRRSLQATLGEAIRFTGYELDRAEVAPGETLLLALHWRADTAIEQRYTVFTHLVGPFNPANQSPVWAQMDGEPGGGSRPTSRWSVGETVDDYYGLQVPLDAPPGDYALEIGMYDPATLARLPIKDVNGVRVADDRLILTTISVKAR